MSDITCWECLENTGARPAICPTCSARSPQTNPLLFAIFCIPVLLVGLALAIAPGLERMPERRTDIAACPPAGTQATGLARARIAAGGCRQLEPASAHGDALARKAIERAAQPPVARARS